MTSKGVYQSARINWKSKKLVTCSFNKTQLVSLKVTSKTPIHGMSQSKKQDGECISAYGPYEVMSCSGLIDIEQISCFVFFSLLSQHFAPKKDQSPQTTPNHLPLLRLFLASNLELQFSAPRHEGDVSSWAPEGAELDADAVNSWLTLSGLRVDVVATGTSLGR